MLSFLVVIISSRYLGADVRGEISLFMLNVTLISMLNNVIGGSAYVYLSSRYSALSLLASGYVWAAVTACVGAWTLVTFSLSQPHLLLHLAAISLLASLNGINLNYLLGKERIRENNLITLSQILILLIVLFAQIFFTPHRGLSVYLNALYVSFGFGFLITLFPIKRYITFGPFSHFIDFILKAARQGILIQSAYIIQLLNYRLSYFLIEAHYGSAMLGIYSVGVSIAEAVWLVSKSIALVQYARVSNKGEGEYAQSLTINLVKLSGSVSFLLIIILVLIPSAFYTFVFGPEFTGIKRIILWLSPGILALAISTIFTHYFSGLGKNHFNTIASGIGLVFTLPLCFLLIPYWGPEGAALAADCAYTGALIYLLIKFMRHSNCSFSDFLPRMADARLAWQLLRK